MAMDVQKLSARAEAARRIEKQPAVRAAAERALSGFVQPIADTLKAQWPREALVFVKRCVDPSRLSADWLAQHFTPLRESLVVIDEAASSRDCAVIKAAINLIKRHSGLKKTREGLTARVSALELAAKCAENGGELTRNPPVACDF